MRPSPRFSSGGPPHRSTRALVVIVAAYLALAVAYSFATRLRWGPDEPGHIAYIESLALDARFPTLGEADVYRPGAAVSHQVQHPPLYYLVAAGVYRAVLFLPEDARIRALRLFSAVLGLAGLWLLWLLAGLVFQDDDRARLTAVAALAFLPLFGYMTAVVNNDALVVPLVLAAFYTMVTIMAGNDRPRRWLSLGVLTGLAILTKEVALALLPILVVGMLAPRGPDGPKLRRRLAGLGVAALSALVIPSAWWIRNLALFGQPVIYAYVQPPFDGAAEVLANPYLALRVASVWARLSFATLWAPYWAMKGVIPPGAYLAVTGSVSAAALVGLALLVTDHVRGAARLDRLRAQVIVLMLAFAALVAAGVLRYTLLVDYRTVEGGRYMLVTWPYLAILGTAAWAYLAGRFRREALRALLLLWIVGDLTVLWAVGRTYNAW